MKILLIHCHYRLPGGEDAVFAAERALLERRGHTVVVYERSNEEAAHGLAKLLLPLHAVWNRRAAREVRDLIAREKPDAVHIHNTLLLLSPAVVRAAKESGMPVVQTLHNFRLFCPNGILLRQGRVCEDCPRHGLSCAVRHRCYRGSLLQTLVVAAAYALHRRLGTWRGVTMVALTDFDRDKLLEFNRLRPLFDADRLVVKPNPVCVEEGPVQLYVYLLAPVPLCRTAGGTERAAHRAGGLGPAGSGCPRPAHRRGGPPGGLGQGPRRAEGDLPRPADPGGTPPPYGRSKGVLAASLCYESFALVPAEAHCLGTPVLASNLGNVGASVRPCIDGLRFAPGDARALAGAVGALLASSFDCEAIAAAARRTYNEEENYRALLRLYTKEER